MAAAVIRRVQGEYRVLVADDDARSRGSLASLLSSEGFDPLPVPGGEEVLRHLEVPSTQIHFLVLDYNMPDLTGLEVLRQVRAKLQLALPAIVVTGEFSRDLEASVLAEGGFALVAKPVQPRPFRQLIWNMVRTELGGS